MEEILQEMKALLRRYYDGDTTPAEESELTAFFTSGVELPADLEPDRRLFKALAEAADAEVPAGLKASIDEMLRQKVKRLRRNTLWISLVSSAAVVALVAGIVFRPQPVLQSEPETLAESVVTDLTTAQPAPFEKPEADAPAAVKAEVKSTSRGRHHARHEKAEAKPYREITDPDEAMREAERALQKVRLSMQPMHRACADANEDLERIDKTLNKILK